MRTKRRASVAIEYALVSALVGVGILVAIGALQGNLLNFYKGWGSTQTQKVQTTTMIDYYKGKSVTTGAPAASSNTSSLMKPLSTYKGPVTILQPKPAPVLVLPKPTLLPKPTATLLPKATVTVLPKATVTTAKATVLPKATLLPKATVTATATVTLLPKSTATVLPKPTPSLKPVPNLQPKVQPKGNTLQQK
jgi:Flp pilus assembly pilin Flp